MFLSLAFSTFTIIAQMVVSHFLRRQIGNLLTDGLLRSAALEMIASAEMCGTCYELIIVADNYGIMAYAVYLFSMTVWWGRSWGSATACTYAILEDYVEKGGSITNVVAKSAAQVLGGISSFRWVKQIWIMEMSMDHMGRGVDACADDLQVPVYLGFVIECVLTCCCRLTSKLLCHREPKYAEFIDSFFATSMVVLAFNYSGGYFNPVLATGLKWGCKGHTNVEHIIVYWAGSILGSMMALKMWQLATVQQVLVGSFDKCTSMMQPAAVEETKVEEVSEKEKKED